MNYSKNNFFVISGGPGVGKTRLLQELNKRGFKSIDETGRTIIQARLKKGLPPRPSLKLFASAMFDIDMQNFLDNIGSGELLFFDRSFLDSAEMISRHDQEKFTAIEKSLTAYRYNRKVFMAPPWKEIYVNDEERDQTFEEAIEIYNNLSAWYQLNEYRTCILPQLPIAERADFILSQIRNGQQ